MGDRLGDCDRHSATVAKLPDSVCLKFTGAETLAVVNSSARLDDLCGVDKGILWSANFLARAVVTSVGSRFIAGKKVRLTDRFLAGDENDRSETLP